MTRARTPSISPRGLALGMLAVMLASPVVTEAQASCAQTGPGLPVEAPVLSVKVSAERASYSRGEVAVLPVEVHDIVQAGPKVGGAVVSVTVSSGSRVLATLHGKTDSSGFSRPKLAITSAMRGRTLTAVATARVLVVDGYDCTGGIVYLHGQGSADPLTKVQ